jgi:hypothetical protein
MDSRTSYIVDIATLLFPVYYSRERDKRVRVIHPKGILKEELLWKVVERKSG